MQRQQLQPFAVRCRRATGGSSPGGCWRTGAGNSQRPGRTCASQPRLCCCSGRQGARSRRAAAACSSVAAMQGSSSAGRRRAAEAAARSGKLSAAQHASEQMMAEARSTHKVGDVLLFVLFHRFSRAHSSRQVFPLGDGCFAPTEMVRGFAPQTRCMDTSLAPQSVTRHILRCLRQRSDSGVQSGCFASFCSSVRCGLRHRSLIKVSEQRHGREGAAVRAQEVAGIRTRCCCAVCPLLAFWPFACTRT